MQLLVLLLLGLNLVTCSSRGRGRLGSPGKMRHKIERPGMGAVLDEKIANLVLANKFTKAKKLCNDVLFASRSNQDRETANYWRTLLLAQEEMEAGNYSKSIELIKRGAKWWKSRAKDYHVKIIKDLLNELKNKEKVHTSLRKKNKNLTRKLKLSTSTSRANKLALENQKLMETTVKLEAENEKLTQLLIDLESR